MTNGDTPEPAGPHGKTPPPADVGPLVAKRTRWPVIFGILGIIVASLGLMGGCCGLAYPFLWTPYANWVSSLDAVPEEAKQAVQAMKPPMLWSVASGLIGLSLGVTLLIGSIKLIGRRPKGVTLCKVWAWITIPWSAVA